MSFLSSLEKKVSDKAVEMLPDDKKEAAKQLSRGDLAAQGLVHKSAAWVQDAAASAKDQRPSANTAYQTQQPPSGSYSQPPFGSYSSCSAAASSGCAPATGAGWAQQQGSYTTGTGYAGPEPSAPPLQHPYTVPNHQQAAGSAASSGSSSSRFTPAPTGAGWKPQHGQGVHGPARQAAAAGGRPAAAAAGNRPAGQAAKLNAREAQARAARMRLGLSVATKLAVVGVGGLVAGCTKKSSTEPGPSAAVQGVPGAAGGDAAAGP
uniref:Uncharacterized protein n=1 Tax=Tetradesmus obliquus TaxID=3088 RepID=A0A383VVE6_TETOB|eukprot:jgi/Sobl393_1/7486/SZX69457.1